MGCLTGIGGMVIPRLLILFGWFSDPTGWSNAFSSQIWPILGFIFMPWTTFFFVIFGAAEVGFDLFRLLIMAVAVLADLGTWGFGAFATRKQVSNYRGM